MQPIYVQKTLIAASSTGIGTLSSASPGVATLNTSNLDTQRRVIIWSTGATLASATFTVTGRREGGGVIRETITGPTSNTVVATTQDFLSVTSVSASSVINNGATIGTNSVGSSPWKMLNWHAYELNVGLAVIAGSSLPNYTVEYTYEDPTGVYPSLSTAAGPTPFSITPLAAQTTTLDSNLIIPVAAVRLTLNSNSSGGNTTLVILQTGIGG
jgi:hypothetical protein